MDVVVLARELAATHPGAKLPCPVCASTVKGENLVRHVDKVHEGVVVPATTTWPGKGVFGLMPCSLVLAGDSLVFLHTLGLLHRKIALDGWIEIGSLWGARPAVPMTSTGEVNTPSEDVRTGSYLRIVEPTSITIGCRGGTQFADHWSRGQWKYGKRARSCDIRVDRTVVVALEYALAQRGKLTPAG